MIKYWTTELENKVAAECVQLHGGWGFMWEQAIARAYANARVQGRGMGVRMDFWDMPYVKDNSKVIREDSPLLWKDIPYL